MVNTLCFVVHSYFTPLQLSISDLLGILRLEVSTFALNLFFLIDSIQTEHCGLLVFCILLSLI